MIVFVGVVPLGIFVRRKYMDRMLHHYGDNDEVRFLTGGGDENGDDNGGCEGRLEFVKN